MDNIEQLSVMLAGQRDSLSQRTSHIARIQSEINRAMERVQAIFSDQPAGQEIIHRLYNAMNEMIRADNALYGLNNELTTYIYQLQK